MTEPTAESWLSRATIASDRLLEALIELEAMGGLGRVLEARRRPEPDRAPAECPDVGQSLSDAHTRRFL